MEVMVLKLCGMLLIS